MRARLVQNEPLDLDRNGQEQISFGNDKQIGTGKGKVRWIEVVHPTHRDEAAKDGVPSNRC